MPCNPGKIVPMKNPLYLLPVVWLLVMGATAQDEFVAPEPMSDEIYDSLFRKSPFRRYLSLTEGMVLTGLAKLPDGVRATVLNRENNQTFIVSRKFNPQGWKIVKIEGGGGASSEKQGYGHQDGHQGKS